MISKTFFDSIPIELHAHKKKVQFFIEEIQSYSSVKGDHNSDVNILEIGCGNGTVVSLPLAELGYNVTGVDLHKPSIELAKTKNIFENAQFVCQDLSEFSANQLYNVVILSDILEHVEHPEKLMAMAASCTEQGGLILISIPNGYGPSELERKFLEFFRIDKFLYWLRSYVSSVLGRKSDAYNSDSGHIQFFRMKEIVGLIDGADLYLKKKEKGSLFGGGITYPIGILCPWIVEPSLRLAQKLPFSIVSTWYFSCERKK